jgi:quinol monooxygenase YgiN
MTFVQLVEVEIETDKIDEVLAEAERWFEETDGRRTQLRELITRDRNDPNRFVVIVFFDSYDSAVKNSELPETRRWAKVVESLTTSISYRDLDVIDERS